MQLSSPAFSDGKDIPHRFTRTGANRSPPLHWSDAPDTVRSFALLVDDLDAPIGGWRHWAIYDLPAKLKVLPEAVAPAEFAQAVNDFGVIGYGDPQPPLGGCSRRYRFRLLALSTDRLDLPPNPLCRHVEAAARSHVLAEAILVGLFH
jgi:Raf kinase inhibitor-like YbhB/YbcL family protein